MSRWKILPAVERATGSYIPVTNGVRIIAHVLVPEQAPVIAASYDLLAALKQLLAEVEEMTRRSGWAGNGGRAMARVAIDKAEGKS